MKPMGHQNAVVLAALVTAGPKGLTSLELVQKTTVLKYTNRIHELRTYYDKDIKCTSERTEAGKIVFRYRLIAAMAERRGDPATSKDGLVQAGSTPVSCTELFTLPRPPQYGV